MLQVVQGYKITTNQDLVLLVEVADHRLVLLREVRVQDKVIPVEEIRMVEDKIYKGGFILTAFFILVISRF